MRYPSTTRLVLFTRDEGALAVFSDATSALGFEWGRHPLAPEVSLKFGFGQDWQKSVERKIGNAPKGDDVEPR
jgi:hypothetical protein